MNQYQNPIVWGSVFKKECVIKDLLEQLARVLPVSAEWFEGLVFETFDEVDAVRARLFELFCAGELKEVTFRHNPGGEKLEFIYEPVSPYSEYRHASFTVLLSILNPTQYENSAMYLVCTTDATPFEFEDVVNSQVLNGEWVGQFIDDEDTCDENK